GACVGGNPVVCTASDQCHLAGTCDPSSGACSNPAKPDGTACNDGNACTQTDACQAGACIGGNPVVCTALDQCHAAGTCDPSSGLCSNPLAECSVVTDSSLCTFDIDSGLADNEFRVIFTPDQNSQSAWKLNASNPGQFYYNVVSCDSDSLNVTLPFPFVTQGAVPIHVYSDVTTTTTHNAFCFAPGTAIANSDTRVTLSNYPNGSSSTMVALTGLPGTGC